MNPEITLKDIITFSLIIIGLFITLRQFKLSKTLGFINRYNDPNFVDIRASVDEWLDSDKDEIEKLNELEIDKRLAAKITIFINLFTELGVAVNKKIVNIPITLDLWNPALTNYWRKLEFYIIDQRENKKNNIGNNFEGLVELHRKYKKSKLLRIMYWLRLGI